MEGGDLRRIIESRLLKKGKDRRKMKAMKSKCIIATALHFSSTIQSILGTRVATMRGIT